MTGLVRNSVIAGAVVALLGAGGLLVRCGSSDAGNRTQSEKSGATGTASRARRTDVVARNEAGAVAAAMAYASASQRWLYLTDEEIRTEIDEAATPRAADDLADDVVDQVSKARTGLAESSGRIWWLVRPLATKVRSFSRDQARIDVWTVTVLSAAEVAAPQAEWMTVQVDLEWIDRAWRVDGVRESPGPTPVPGPEDDPWDAGDFDKALDGFTRVDGEPVS